MGCKIFIAVVLLGVSIGVNSQQKFAADSITPIAKEQAVALINDTLKKAPKPHNPKTATRRSAIIPGWGQAYNKQYWKIPIVVGALAIPTATYIFNNTQYKRASYAYEARFNATFLNDTTGLAGIHPDFVRADLASLQNYRNIVRRDRDYSILWFFILWGVNVVDATVFGHLKDFNVSKDLSMRVTPTYNPQVKSTGVNMVFGFRNNNLKKPTSVLSR
jgi:hypothetical protein